MIEYCVYRRDASIIICDKPFSCLEGTFTNEDYAKLFIKALIKKYPPSKNITYFINKWDTEKNMFVK